MMTPGDCDKIWGGGVCKCMHPRMCVHVSMCGVIPKAITINTLQREILKNPIGLMLTSK